MMPTSLTSVPSLDELLAALEQAIKSAPVSDLPVLLGHIEQVKAMAWCRMLTGSQPNEQKKPRQGNSLLTADQVAKHLNVPKSFVYEAARQHRLKPVKLGKKYIRFTEVAVQEYQANSGA